MEAFKKLDRPPKDRDVVLGGDSPGPKMGDMVLGSFTPEQIEINTSFKQKQELEYISQELDILLRILGLQ